MPQVHTQPLHRAALTKQKKKCFLHAYIRLNANTYIPPELAEVIGLFWNNVRSVHITGENLEDFLYCNKPITTQTFSTKETLPYNIQFRMSLHPNGLRQSKPDGIEFFLKLKALHPDIASILIYYELFNQDTQTEWKGVSSLQLNEHIVWPCYLLRLSQCKLASSSPSNSLLFSSDLKILSLFLHNGQQIDVAKPVLMSKYEQYHWQIDDAQTMHKVYSAQHGYCVLSPNFGGTNDDNWCIKYYPQGIKANDYRGAVFVRLLRTPAKIKKLRVKYKIVDDVDQTVLVQEIKEFSHDVHSHGYWMEKLSKNAKQPRDYLAFTVHIDVLQIFDYQDQVVPIPQWSKYGFSRFKPF